MAGSQLSGAPTLPLVGVWLAVVDSFHNFPVSCRLILRAVRKEAFVRLQPIVVMRNVGS